MNRNKKLLCALILVAVVASAFGIAHGDDPASLWTTYDDNPTHYRNEFPPGEVVYIFWYPTGSSQIIRISDEDGNVLKDFGIVNTQPQQWQIPADAAVGTMYWVEIPGKTAGHAIAVATIQVLPEVSWTPLAASVGGFAVFALFARHKSRKYAQK